MVIEHYLEKDRHTQYISILVCHIDGCYNWYHFADEIIPGHIKRCPNCGEHIQQKINSELRRKNILFHANSPPPELDDIDMEDFEDDYLSPEEFNDLIC